MKQNCLFPEKHYKGCLKREIDKEITGSGGHCSITFWTSSSSKTITHVEIFLKKIETKNEQTNEMVNELYVIWNIDFYCVISTKTSCNNESFWTLRYKYTTTYYSILIYYSTRILCEMEKQSQIGNCKERKKT